MAASIARRAQALYDSDRQAWLRRQEELARSGGAAELDLVNIAEELREVGASERRELRNRLVTLLMHLLKYEFQPRARSKSWLGTIAEQRDAIDVALQESPSLQLYLEELFVDPRVYTSAIRRATLETGLNAEVFPKRFSHPLDSLLDPDFWPGKGPHPVLARGRRP